MSLILIERIANLNGPIIPDTLNGVLNGSEIDAHKFIVTAMRDGATVALAGTVTASFLRADGAEVVLTGEIENGAATVTLAQSCYAVPGRFDLTIFVTADGVKTGVYACTGGVRNTTSGTIVDPGQIVPSVDDIIAKQEELAQDVANASSAIESAQNAVSYLAPGFSPSKTYEVGEYVTQDGALYICTTAVETAGEWDAANWQAVTFGGEVTNLKSAVAECAPLFTENLIANTNIISGYTIAPATGKPIAVSGWNITDYIELRPGIPYHCINIGKSGFAFYDVGKNYIDLRSNAQVCSENKLLSVFVLPDDVMYGRFSIYDDGIGIAMLSSYDLYDSGNTVDGKLTKNERIAFAGANAFMAMRYKDGESALSENMYRQGSVDNNGTYVTYRYNRRIVSKYLEWYPFDIIYSPSNGARMFYLKFSNGAYVSSAWTSSQLTIPAKTSFLLCVESASNAQVAEICQMVTAAGVSLELPSYYYDNGYINNKIDTIIDKSPLDGLQFAFLTDAHVRNNAGISPDLIRYIRKNTNAIPFVVFGGDVLITTVEEGVDVREDMRVWQTWMNKIGKSHVYQAQGNHDYLGYHYVNGERVVFNEPLSVCRQLVIGNLEDAKIVNAPGKLWYYVDIPTANTRIIFLNDYDTTRNDGVFYGYNGMSVDQIRWIVEKALDTDGLRVLFVSHQTYDTEMQGENQTVFAGMQSLFTAIANHTAYSYGPIVKDFTGSTIEFVAHICGHMHADASNVNNGVLTIQTTCDAYYGRSESVGTIAEQAFDIVTVDYTNSKLYTTRIGSGNDREFDI